MDGEITLGDAFLHPEGSENSTIRDICISAGGKYVAAVGQNTYLYSKSEPTIHIPRAATAFTAAAFVMDGDKELLMAATASRDIHEFDVNGEYTDWSNNAKIPTQWRGYRSKVVAITQHNQSPILLCDNESFTVLDRRQEKSNLLRKIKSRKGKR